MQTFLASALRGDLDTSWSVVSAGDRQRIGYPERIAEQLRSVGWTSSNVTSVDADVVTVDVRQTPKISDIDGVVAASATVRIPTVQEAGEYRVNWSRRMVEQHFPQDSADTDVKVTASLENWIAARQQCISSPPNQFDGGLVGVVGLAAQLCGTNGRPDITSVGDLDTLDEPQPVIESFGASALRWARVVKVAGPVPLNAVLAPRGTDWIVVAIARPSIADS